MPGIEISNELKKHVEFSNAIKAAMGEPARFNAGGLYPILSPIFKPSEHKTFEFNLDMVELLRQNTIEDLPTNALNPEYGFSHYNLNNVMAAELGIKHARDNETLIIDLSTVGMSANFIPIDSLTNFGVEIISKEEYAKKILDKSCGRLVAPVGYDKQYVCMNGMYETIASTTSRHMIDSFKDYDVSGLKEMVPLSSVNPFCNKARMKEVVVKPYGEGKHYKANQEGKQVAIAKRRAARKRNKKKL